MIETQRLILRQWRPEDHGPFAELNADPKVMEFFPSTHPAGESDALAERNRDGITENGWGLWAVETRASGEFAGFTGLMSVPFEASFTPAVEVGWRLAHRFWGHGYAPEAARAAMAFGFDQLGLAEIVAMTAEKNLRSRRVMEKLAMTYDSADDFDHPKIAEGHPIRPHVLYRRRRDASTVS
jgi:ribosomal-protein-alanine N-acetyltransferase